MPMGKMRYYFTTMKYGFKCKFIYRASALLGTFSGVTTFLIQIVVWRAFLGSGARFDTTFELMLTYLVITQIATSFVASFSGGTISRLINNGDISIYLMRPIKLKTHLFLEDFGKNIFTVFFQNVPVCLILILFFGFQLPASHVVAPISLLMLINGVIMLFHYRYMLGLMSFWLIRNPFTSWGFQNAESIFSGKVLPIWLYPAWLAALTRFLPFRYFTYEPVALFVGKTSLENAWSILLIQYAWIAAFLVLEKLITNRAMNKLIVQGG